MLEGRERQGGLWRERQRGGIKNSKNERFIMNIFQYDEETDKFKKVKATRSRPSFRRM